MMTKFSEAIELYWPLYKQRELYRQPLAQALLRVFKSCMWRVQARLQYGFAYHYNINSAASKWTAYCDNFRDIHNCAESADRVAFNKLPPWLTHHISRSLIYV